MLFVQVSLKSAAYNYIKMNLPLYIIDKILQYNIHPIAQLIKPLFDCEFYDDYLN